MPVRKMTLDGKDYVLVPRKQWDAMVRRAGDERERGHKLPPANPDGTFGLEHVRLSLANKMIARRKALGLTQAQLAQRAKVRVETISRLENGLHMPGQRTFDKIDKALTRAAKHHAA